VLRAFNVLPENKIKIDGERTPMKITAVNPIRIPVLAIDCTIIQSVQAACTVAEVKNKWSCNLLPHTPP